MYAGKAINGRKQNYKNINERYGNNMRTEILLNDKTIKKFYNATAYKQEKDVAISAFLEYIFNQKTVDDFTSKIDSFIQNIKQQEVNKKEFCQKLLLL